MERDFTLKKYRELLTALKGYGEIVLRHDVDLRPQNSLATARIEAELGWKAVYFFRAVPESWDERIIREIAALRHEVGYHYESLTTCNGDVDAAWEDFKKNLEILLDFVQHPYFTQQTVEKEQGIIGQEIDMYKDVPDWEVMFNCLRTMYHNLPVRIDIAGTQESIAQISADVLYGCYKNFYNLNNMVLAVAGNTTVDEVLEVADRILKPQEGKMAQRKLIDEPKEVISDYCEESLSVATPQFMLGFKEHWDTPERTEKEEIAMGMLLDIIAGHSSPLYKRLLDMKLINTTFDYEYFDGFDFSCVLFSGESSDPKAVAEEIKKEIKYYRENGIDEKIFSRTLKKFYGKFIMDFNDVDGLANIMALSYFAGDNIFSVFDIYKTITADYLEELLGKTLLENYSALSVILPEEE